MKQPVLQDILPIVRSAGQIILGREGAAAIKAKAAQDFVTEVAHLQLRVYQISIIKRISSSVYTKAKIARNGSFRTIPAIHVAGTVTRYRQTISITVPVTGSPPAR